MGGESSNLSPGNHSLRRQRNLPRTSAAERNGNLQAAPNFKQRDNVVDRNACDEPKLGRCDIHGSLRVVDRARFIGTSGSELPRQLRDVLSLGEFA